MGAEFNKAMSDLGFMHRSGGIFSKKVNLDFYEWISVDVSSVNGDVLVGAIFPKINKKLYEIAKFAHKGAKPSFPMSWGPPAFSHKLGTTADANLMQPRNLVDSAEAFLEGRVDLELVIGALRAGELFSWNRSEVVASGLVVLGRCDELSQFVRDNQAQGTTREFLQTAEAICTTNE